MTAFFGGQISCESEFRVGTSFKFFFRLDDPENVQDEGNQRCYNPVKKQYAKFKLHAGPKPRIQRQSMRVESLSVLEQRRNSLLCHSYRKAFAKEQLAKRVLVCDDDVYNRAAIKIIMQNCNIPWLAESVDFAKDGAKGVQLVRNGLERGVNYGLVLMDCQMPVMDGYEATVQIRELYRAKEKEQPRIVAQTGHVETKYIEKAFRSGMDEVMPKPLKFQLVKKVVAEMVESE